MNKKQPIKDKRASLDALLMYSFASKVPRWQRVFKRNSAGSYKARRLEGEPRMAEGGHTGTTYTFISKSISNQVVDSLKANIYVCENGKTS